VAKFFTGNELNAELEKIFEQAEKQIILISPYIQLHDRYASTLKTKKDNHKLEIIIVFGKNSEDLTKSMKQEDFIFFKEFPNIQIRYEKRLHAKYYANESAAILTSMNLYSYSQDNNIEAGIMTKSNLAHKLINNVAGEDSLDNQAYNYFKRVIDQSELLFYNKPKFDKKYMGLTNKYSGSIVELDMLSSFFEEKNKYEEVNQKTNYEKKKVSQKSEEKQTHTGYCIRTGKPIPFNIKIPMTDQALQSWKKFEKVDYAEKFCHFSGEPSNGETTYEKPILKKNWALAKKAHNFK
jgi:hypothetical protein